uniref:GIY-YIG endonuclease n=1 Tax=Scytalidium sp. TaxID=1715249 RepID=A0A513U0R9_9PEZI|nr:GIY-YIG endonuclease [Scytalidium sp.]
MKNQKLITKLNRPMSSWPSILGREGPISNAYRLATQYVNEGKPITAVEVNKVLAFSGISISQDMLNEILSRPRLNFPNLDSSTIKTDKFLQTIGTVRGKIQVPGVYIWTHLVTGDMYVGSSSKLARRLIGYFNNNHKDTGKLIPLIKKEGVGAFNLQVIPLTESYTANQELCLEQYFLLQPKFNLNTLRVVNDYSGARAIPLYMYTKDLSELIYSSNIQEDFIFKLKIHYSFLSNSLKTGGAYLDKYVFTDKPVVGAKESNMSIEDINLMLDKDRFELQKNKGRKVIIKGIEGNKDTIIFDSVSSCVAFLNNIAPSNKSTLRRHIESGKPYNGYLCQWDTTKSDVNSSIIDKSIEVQVTHVPTDATAIYPSFRKAALSFAPDYITTGPTLKVFAENGKLFKGEFKITILKDKK